MKTFTKFIFVIAVALACFVTFQAFTIRDEFDSSEKKAIEIGRDFLYGEDFKTGKVLSIRLEEKKPNFYWNYELKFERPDITGLLTCWVIKFEQKRRPGHFFEVWIDVDEYVVVGGGQCR